MIYSVYAALLTLEDTEVKSGILQSWLHLSVEMKFATCILADKLMTGHAEMLCR